MKAAFLVLAVVAGFDGHRVSGNQRIRRNLNALHDGPGGNHAVVPDVRAALDYAMRTDEDAFFEHDRFSIDIRSEFQASTVRIGYVDRHEWCDVTVVADSNGGAGRVDDREGSDVHTGTDRRLPKNPHQRMERVGRKICRLRERTGERIAIHTAILGPRYDDSRRGVA